MKLADVCSLAVLLWGLAALAWPDSQKPQSHRLATPAAVQAPQPQPQPIPDRRTLTAFPGP